ncbi:MAG: dephospho-CoA kinase [Rhodothermia bacterium]
MAARTLGITGGIGSGKSTVCDILETFGARIFKADDVGKQSMTDNRDVRQEVTDMFGVDSYKVGGKLNTAYLAEVVFADPERVRAINAIVHPRVLAAFEDAASMARRDGINVLVLESALLFQSGGHELVDSVAVVDAPPAIRRLRVIERDGIEREAVDARMRHQMSAAELRKRADYVIRNHRSIEDLRDAVAELYRIVLKQ